MRIKISLLLLVAILFGVRCRRKEHAPAGGTKESREKRYNQFC